MDKVHGTWDEGAEKKISIEREILKVLEHEDNRTEQNRTQNVTQ